MEFHEVKSLRERRFGLTPKTAIRDASGAREFIHRVGFCFTRADSALLLPSFLGAVVLTPEPAAKVPGPVPAKASAKSKRPAAPRSGEDIVLPLLREKSVFEGRLLRDRSTLVSSPFLPYFYALVGESAGAGVAAPEPPTSEAETPPEDDEAIAGDDAEKDEEPAPVAASATKKTKGAAAKKTPAAAKKKAPAKKKAAAAAAGGAAPPVEGTPAAVEAAVHKILETDGPTGARTLATKFTKATGLAEEAMNDAVRRLESRLRVATIDHSDSDGPVYDTFERFRPDAVREGKKLPRLEAAMRILGRYFETVIAAEASHVADVFGSIFSADELPELLKALEERKEVDPDTQLVRGKTYWVCREAAWGDL